jgi:DNA-binding transcriptional ArsR family regulator
MNVTLHDDAAVARIAGAIGDRARARILYSLADGHARTSTELAVVAEVSASTASAHLNRLKAERLIKVHAQGKHRYYSLEGPNVASVLEGLSVLAGGRVTNRFVPNTPSQLRTARTCYDHIAGTLGVLLHDCFQARRPYLMPTSTGHSPTFAHLVRHLDGGLPGFHPHSPISARGRARGGLPSLAAGPSLAFGILAHLGV